MNTPQEEAAFWQLLQRCPAIPIINTIKEAHLRRMDLVHALDNAVLFYLGLDEGSYETWVRQAIEEGWTKEHLIYVVTTHLTDEFDLVPLRPLPPRPVCRAPGAQHSESTHT